MVQYLRTHNTADKAETEHFLRAMNRGGWDGLRLAGWIERKAVGQWQPGDPKPLPRTQKITETVVSELAKGRQVASLWALQERLQRVVELDGAQGDPVQREDPWGAFQKWRWSPGGKTPALFMFPVCLVASVICPDLLEKKFAKMGDGFELDVFRGEAVDMLAAIAEEGQLLILGEENLELEEWLEGWAEEEIPDSFQLVFHKTVPEMRRRRLEVQSIFKDWADEDEKDEIILS